MTRIAAGDPAIWPDMLFENREAIDQTSWSRSKNA
jgi:prephenate dehydrogenase